MQIKSIEISYNTIKAEVKPGYVVLNNSRFSVVTNVGEDTVTLDDGLVISYPQAEENIVKFVGNDGQRMYAIRHTDFELLVYLLNQEDKDPNTKYNTKAEALLAGESVHVRGYIDATFSALRVGDIVKVKDIEVIDALQLYNPESRVAKVLFSGRGNVNIELVNVKDKKNVNRNETLTVNREAIETVQRTNLFFMYRICCPVCKR